MENSYGIGVHNRYDLFYNDDVDPYDLIKETEKKVKSSEKENKGTNNKVLTKKGNILKKSTKTETTAKISDKTNASEPRSQNRGPRNNDARMKFSDREERNNRRNRPDEFNNRFDGERDGRVRPDGENKVRFDGEGRGRFDGEGRGRGRGGRGMGRGRGRGRGGMGTGPDGRGKREYDRQSGMVTSGVKAVDKREGSGAFNWGSDKDEIEEFGNNENETQAELDTSNENAEKTDDAEKKDTEDEAAKEEEHHEMTLDEWKALQGQRSKPQFNVRKAGEGENTNQWKKTYVLKKKEEDEETDEEDEEDEDDDDIQHGRRKVLLNIDFKFSDTPMRGRGRGRGRGGERGGKRGMGGRGGSGGGAGGERAPGPRGDRGRGGRGGRQEAPRMDDEHDFPSLG